MTSFLSEYEDTTNTIDSIVTTQLSSVLDWVNVPGSLSKVVSSAAGYAWGIDSSAAYICQLPCSGKWQPVDLGEFNLTSILDIEADETNVYILGINTGQSTILLINSASNQGTFSQVKVPFDAKQIFSTHSFIWGQDGSNVKQRCPKPCTMSNWLSSSDTTIKITSSSDSALYGIDSQGNAMKSDEGLQTGWSPISELSGVHASTVIGDIDQTGLYGIDTKSNVFKLQGNTVVPQPTQGYVPQHISIEPTTKQMWMTSETPGQLGNIFSKLENPDYTTIVDSIQPLDKSRDAVVSDVTHQFDTQTQVMTVNKQVSDIVKYFKNMFNLDKTVGQKGKEQAGHLEEQIRSTQTQLDLMANIQPMLQKVIALLIVVAGMYLVGSILGWILHVLAIIVLVGGMIYILKFS